MKNIIIFLKSIVAGNLVDKLLHAVLFAMAFSVMGFYIPRTYLTYFDKTDYYKIYSPVAVDQRNPHYPCEAVEVSFTKESLIDGKGSVNIALNLYQTNENNLKKRVGYQERSIPLTKGEEVITTTWDVDCNRKPGEYFFEGVLTYQLNGNTKTHSFYSEKFNIIEKPKEIIK